MQNNSKIVLRFVEEVLNQGHIDSIDQFFREDLVEQVPIYDAARGVSPAKGMTAKPPGFSCRECPGRLMVPDRSPRQHIAERLRRCK